MRIFSAFLLLLFTAECLAQEKITYKTESLVAVQGIDGWQQVGKQLLVPSSSKPKLVPIGRFQIEDDFDSVSVLAESVNGLIPVPVEQVAPKEFFVFGSGKVRVLVTVANQDPFMIKTYRELITIEPLGPDDPDEPDEPDDPDPPPEPDDPDPPEIPDDEFDNIGKRVFEWSSPMAAGTNGMVGEIYLKYSNLAATSVKTINTLNLEMNKEIRALGGEIKKYEEIFKKIEADTRGRWNPQFTKAVLSKYWKAIGTGFKASL